MKLLSKWALPALWLLVIAVVLGVQSYHVGFWHELHGFVSSHGLALMTHATPENGFVGYSRAIVQPDGSIFYDYFDRYPFFYNAFGNLLLRLTDHIPTEIYLMRQWMNVIFILTLLVAYWLVRRLVANRYLAFAVVIFAASSYHLLYYKDMIHYDQPALLLMLGLIAVIDRYERGQVPNWGLLLVALAVVVIARGYVSFFVLGLWFLVTVIDALRAPGWGARIGRVLRLPALWVSVAAVLWVSVWLGYNLLAEARTRDVPLLETSIADSALRQLPIPGVERGREVVQPSDRGLASWGQFGVVQTERLALWAVPGKLAGEMDWRFRPLIDDFAPNPWRVAGGIAVLLLALWGVARTPPPARRTALLLAFTGVVWMFFMFNLTAYHIYVTMYAFGLTLVAYVGALRWTARYPVLVGALVVLCLVAFAVTNWQVRRAQNATLEQSAPYTYDLHRAAEHIEPAGKTVMTSPEYRRPFCIINNDMCFALGYYFGGHTLTATYDYADYVLSPRPFFTLERFAAPGETISLIRQPLTPQNEVVHLLDVAQAEPVTAPGADALHSRYGDHIQLAAWSLRGEVQVRPCHAVTVDSWWRAAEVPPQNLNLQVVMVGADGSAVTESNTPLGAVPTSIWEPERLTADIRPLTVPCDTPPGEYPLILGVYDPATLAPLPAYDAAGNPVGNQVYLTTLFVE